MSAQRSILLIEDESITAELLKAQIQAMGHRVCAVGVSAAQAYELALTHRPDLIIMDIKLKGAEDGIDAAQRLCGAVDAPVIFLTAVTDEEVFERAREAGPYGYVTKPYTAADLRHQIELVFTRREMERRLEASELRYRRLVEDMPHMVCRLDKNLCITFANAAFQTRYGRDNESGSGSFFPAIFGDMEAKPMASRIRNLSQANPITVCEVRTDVPGEGLRWQRWTVRGFFDTGEETEYQAIGEDITTFRQLEEELIRIAERERLQISHEIHDELGQKLSYLGFLAEMAKKAFPTGEAAEKISEISRLLREAVDQARGIARGLLAVSPGPEGFIEAIEQHAEDLRKFRSVKVEITKQGDVWVPDPFIALHLYHIVRELLTNAAKHGRGAVSLSMAENAHDLLIVVENEVPSNPPKDSNGIGLNLIRHRANLICAGLSFTVENGVFRAVVRVNATGEKNTK